MAAATTMAAAMTEARAMAASMAVRACDKDDDNIATMPMMMLTPTMTKITLKRTTMTITTGGRTAVQPLLLPPPIKGFAIPLCRLSLTMWAPLLLSSLSTMLASSHPSCPWLPLSTSLLDRRRRHQRTTASKRRRNKRQRPRWPTT